MLTWPNEAYCTMLFVMTSSRIFGELLVGSERYGSILSSRSHRSSWICGWFREYQTNGCHTWDMYYGRIHYFFEHDQLIPPQPELGEQKLRKHVFAYVEWLDQKTRRVMDLGTARSIDEARSNSNPRQAHGIRCEPDQLMAYTYPRYRNAFIVAKPTDLDTIIPVQQLYAKCLVHVYVDDVPDARRTGQYVIPIDIIRKLHA